MHSDTSRYRQNNMVLRCQYVGSFIQYLHLIRYERVSYGATTRILLEKNPEVACYMHVITPLA